MTAAGSQPPARKPRRRWRRVVAAVVVVVALLVAAGVIINHAAHGYYAFSPGTAPRLTGSAACQGNGNLALPNGTPCVRLVVPPDHRHGITGEIMMVDVLVGPATPVEYVLSKLGILDHFHDGMQLIPASEVLGSTPPGQLDCQDAQQMNGATESASVVALRHLGYQVHEHDLGAQIDEVVPGSPAAAAGMHCNDVVTAIDDQPIRTAGDLSAAIKAHHVGDRVTVTVQRTANGKTQVHHLSATLERTPAQTGQPGSDTAFLGVASESRTTFTLPFNVSIDVGAIGGPSAGLAFTLGLLDVLSNGHLTGGHHIAATGTISLDGTVGDVGGVAQKTVAVRNAGADVFFVPSQEYATAHKEAGKMRVYPVSTLQQALNDLQKLGGTLPTVHAAAAGAVR